MKYPGPGKTFHRCVGRYETDRFDFIPGQGIVQNPFAVLLIVEGSGKYDVRGYPPVLITAAADAEKLCKRSLQSAVVLVRGFGKVI